MARIGYNMTQDVLDEYYKFTGEKVTGMLFRYSTRYFMTCSCGLHQETSNRPAVCPKCGGKIADIPENKLMRSNFRRDKAVLEKSGNSFTVIDKSFRLWYDSSKSCYSSRLSEIPVIKGTLSPRSIEDISPAGYNIGYPPLMEVFKLPEFNVFNVMSNGYNVRCINDARAILELIDEFGITDEEIARSPYLYGHYLGDNAKSSGCHETFENYLKRVILIRNPKAIEFAKVNDMSFPYYWGGIGKIGGTLDYVFSGEMSIGSFLADMMSRGVYTVQDVDTIVETHKKLCEGELSVPRLDAGVSARWMRDTIKVDKHLAEEFERFCKKYSYMKARLVSEFEERVATLRMIGQPLVWENFVDKQYFSIVNAPKFVYKGENFEADFEKNPLETLKKMK